MHMPMKKNPTWRMQSMTLVLKYQQKPSIIRRKLAELLTKYWTLDRFAYLDFRSMGLYRPLS